MSQLLMLLSKVPAEAFESLGKLVGHLLNGDAEAAQREARVTAETIAAKKTIDAAYEAGARSRANKGE